MADPGLEQHEAAAWIKALKKAHSSGELGGDKAELNKICIWLLKNKGKISRDNLALGEDFPDLILDVVREAMGEQGAPVAAPSPQPPALAPVPVPAPKVGFNLEAEALSGDDSAASGPSPSPIYAEPIGAEAEAEVPAASTEAAEPPAADAETPGPAAPAVASTSPTPSLTVVELPDVPPSPLEGASASKAPGSPKGKKKARKRPVPKQRPASPNPARGKKPSGSPKPSKRGDKGGATKKKKEGQDKAADTPPAAAAAAAPAEESTSLTIAAGPYRRVAAAPETKPKLSCPGYTTEGLSGLCQELKAHEDTTFAVCLSLESGSCFPALFFVVKIRDEVSTIPIMAERVLCPALGLEADSLEALSKGILAHDRLKGIDGFLVDGDKVSAGSLGDVVTGLIGELNLKRPYPEVRASAEPATTWLEEHPWFGGFDEHACYSVLDRHGAEGDYLVCTSDEMTFKLFSKNSEGNVQTSVITPAELPHLNDKRYDVYSNSIDFWFDVIQTQVVRFTNFLLPRHGKDPLREETLSGLVNAAQLLGIYLPDEERSVEIKVPFEYARSDVTSEVETEVSSPRGRLAKGGKRSSNWLSRRIRSSLPEATSPAERLPTAIGTDASDVGMPIRLLIAKRAKSTSPPKLAVQVADCVLWLNYSDKEIQCGAKAPRGVFLGLHLGHLTTPAPLAALRDFVAQVCRQRAAKESRLDFVADDLGIPAPGETGLSALSNALFALLCVRRLGFVVATSPGDNGADEVVAIGDPAALRRNPFELTLINAARSRSRWGDLVAAKRAAAAVSTPDQDPEAGANPGLSAQVRTWAICLEPAPEKREKLLGPERLLTSLHSPEETVILTGLADGLAYSGWTQDAASASAMLKKLQHPTRIEEFRACLATATHALAALVADADVRPTLTPVVRQAVAWDAAVLELITQLDLGWAHGRFERILTRADMDSLASAINRLVAGEQEPVEPTCAILSREASVEPVQVGDSLYLPMQPQRSAATVLYAPQYKADDTDENNIMTMRDLVPDFHGFEEDEKEQAKLDKRAKAKLKTLKTMKKGQGLEGLKDQTVLDSVNAKRVFELYFAPLLELDSKDGRRKMKQVLMDVLGMEEDAAATLLRHESGSFTGTPGQGGGIPFRLVVARLVVKKPPGWLSSTMPSWFQLTSDDDEREAKAKLCLQIGPFLIHFSASCNLVLIQPALAGLVDVIAAFDLLRESLDAVTLQFQNVAQAIARFNVDAYYSEGDFEERTAKLGATSGKFYGNSHTFVRAVLKSVSFLEPISCLRRPVLRQSQADSHTWLWGQLTGRCLEYINELPESEPIRSWKGRTFSTHQDLSELAEVLDANGVLRDDDRALLRGFRRGFDLGGEEMRPPKSAPYGALGRTMVRLSKQEKNSVAWTTVLKRTVDTLHDQTVVSAQLAMDLMKDIQAVFAEETFLELIEDVVPSLLTDNNEMECQDLETVRRRLQVLLSHRLSEGSLMMMSSRRETGPSSGRDPDASSV